MMIKKISLSPPLALSVFLLAMGCFSLFMELNDYIFVSFIGPLLNICFIFFIVLITINGLENRDTAKGSTVFSIFLPLIAIFFLVLKIFFILKTNFIDVDMVVICCFFICVSKCSMKLFSFYVQGKFLRSVLGTVYSAILGVICVLVVAGVALELFFGGGDFVAVTTVKSKMSPNSVYLAEVIEGDAGATGGSTRVKIIPQNHINLFIGALKKESKNIYYGRWGEAGGMTLRWETDEILYVNKTKYDMKDVY